MPSASDAPRGALVHKKPLAKGASAAVRKTGAALCCWAKEAAQHGSLPNVALNLFREDDKFIKREAHDEHHHSHVRLFNNNDIELFSNRKECSSLSLSLFLLLKNFYVWDFVYVLYSSLGGAPGLSSSS